MAVFQDGIGSKNFVPRGGQVTTTSVDPGDVAAKPVLKTPESAPDLPDFTDLPRTGGSSSGGSSSGGVGPVDTSTPATTGQEMETGGCKANCGDPGPASESGNVPTGGQGRTADTDPNAENNPPPPVRTQSANVQAIAGMQTTQLLLLGFAVPFIFSLLTGK